MSRVSMLSRSHRMLTKLLAMSGRLLVRCAPLQVRSPIFLTSGCRLPQACPRHVCIGRGLGFRSSARRWVCSLTARSRPACRARAAMGVESRNSARAIGENSCAQSSPRLMHTARSGSKRDSCRSCRSSFWARHRPRLEPLKAHVPLGQSPSPMAAISAKLGLWFASNRCVVTISGR